MEMDNNWKVQPVHYDQNPILRGKFWLLCLFTFTLLIKEGQQLGREAKDSTKQPSSY